MIKKGTFAVFILITVFGLGYLTKHFAIKNEGWETFDSKKWIPYENGVHGKNYRKKNGI